MKTAPKIGGWKRQQASSKDRPFVGVKQRIAEATGDSTDLRKWCTPVESQGQLGSCVANAAVGGLELVNVKSGRPAIDLSRLFVYYNARLFHGAQDKDEGTYIRLAMNTLEALGTCLETSWAYVPGNVFVRPKWKCYSEAYGHKIGRYELIGGTGSDRLDAVEDALSGGYPVAFGMDVTQGFMNTGRDGVADFSGPSLGLHAMLIVGALPKKKQLIVRNSWGEDFGDQGYCYIDYGALDDREGNDFWVIYESPRFK